MTRSILVSTALASAALAVLAAHAAQAVADSEPRGRLGVSGVAVERSGGSIVVKRQGREFASFAVPRGTHEVLVCCFAGKCEPIQSNTFLACDIVIHCVGDHCFPK